MLQFYARGIEANVQAGVVARRILTAIEEGAERLRYAFAWGGVELSR